MLWRERVSTSSAKKNDRNVERETFAHMTG